MFKLRRFLKDYKLQLIIGPACKLFEAILELCVPLVMASIIDRGIQKNDMNHIIVMGVVLVLLGVVGLGSALVCQYMASYTSQGAGTKIRTALLAHINGLSYKELEKDGLAEAMSDELKALEKAMEMDKERFIRIKKDEIIPFIEEEIVTRYWYQEAGVKVRLRYDKQLHKALELSR